MNQRIADVPRPEAAPGVHAEVLRQLARLDRGRLLDAPAGRGALSAAARDLGFDVTSCELEPEQFVVPGLRCDRVDLQGILPYADYAFDVVVSVEAIEHVENPFHVLREFRRVLRPRGALVLTTPNVLSLSSRARQLMTGLATWFDFDTHLRVDGHITPIGAPQLQEALARAGFTIRGLSGNQITRGGRLLAPLAPLVRWTTARAVADPELRSLLTSHPVLFTEILVVVAA